MLLSETNGIVCEMCITIESNISIWQERDGKRGKAEVK